MERAELIALVAAPIYAQIARHDLDRHQSAFHHDHAAEAVWRAGKLLQEVERTIGREPVSRAPR